MKLQYLQHKSQIYFLKTLAVANDTRSVVSKILYLAKYSGVFFTTVITILRLTSTPTPNIYCLRIGYLNAS